MTDAFIEGRMYKYTLDGIVFPIIDCMNGVLDGKPHKCLSVGARLLTFERVACCRAQFEGIRGSWLWPLHAFIEDRMGEVL